MYHKLYKIAFKSNLMCVQHLFLDLFAKYFLCEFFRLNVCLKRLLLCGENEKCTPLIQITDIAPEHTTYS